MPIIKRDYKAVVRVQLPHVKPFKAQVLIQSDPRLRWRTIGYADSQAVAEAIARAYRIDNRGAQTRIKERRRPGGFAYIGV